MRSVFVWTKEPGWLSRDAYPAVHQRFEIEQIREDATLPSRAGVLLVDEALVVERRADSEAFARDPGKVRRPVIAVAPTPDSSDELEIVFEVVEWPPRPTDLLRKLNNATYYLDNQLRLAESQRAAEQKAQELAELHAIGIALSTEHDHERLLNLILSKAREITNADAGSLFLVAKLDMPIELPGGTLQRVGGRWLRFRLSQNDSLELRFEEDILEIGSDSIAGYVAQTGETLNLEDAYAPPADKPFVINRSFDEATGYRTRSILVVPMQNHEGESIGVLQLINKKKARDIVLDNAESFEQNVLSFDEHDERLVRSLASQAAVSVENNSLYLQRENLFARFVDAAVQAIESRDPTTQGHSKRVAAMTTELARVTNRVERGSYRDFRLSSEQVRELKYAALLHDFGKVGVKERVLVKATKLYHGQLSVVRQRFKTIRRTLEVKYLREMLDRLLRNDATPEQIEQMKEELARKLSVVEEARSAVEGANKPTVRHHSDFGRLEELGTETFEDVDGSERPYLEPEEIVSLTVSRGTLTDDERKMIQSHVDHTYDFLSTIPWTRDLQNIPVLAQSHHEKLDGTGYPNGLGAEEIPPQTRMMTISDIYDALTAKDRPYKPAVKTETALGYLEEEAKLGQLDLELLDLFIEAKVYEEGLTN